MNLYIDPDGNPSNRVPEGFQPGWRLNTVPPFTPPGTAKRD